MNDTHTDPIVRACAVADRLKAKGLPVTKDTIDAEFRALDADTSAYTPPNPYAAGLAALRAAAATPETTFEDRYKAERLAALAAEHRENPVVYRAARDLASYAAPDPYAAGLKAMREQRR